jgi:hypothetical protein
MQDFKKIVYNLKENLFNKLEKSSYENKNG